MEVEAGLGDACEHFVAGSYDTYLERRGLPVPLWARVNLVAHADVLELLAAANAAGRSCPAKRPSSWPEARGWMAEALLRSAAANDATPAEIQCEALVPLESLLAGSRQGQRTRRDRRRDVRGLVALVEAALPPRR